MYDSDLAKILPAWATWSKSKQDKVWKEYQQFSFSSEHEQQFDEYSKEADIIERQRFLQKLPTYLDDRNYIGLMPMLEENFDEKDDDYKKDLCKEMWDTAAGSIINALDARDAMLQMQMLRILLPISTHNGRAIRILRKSKKLAPWLKFCLSEGTFLSVAPIQDLVLMVVRYAILGCKRKFLDELMEERVPMILFSKIQKCCPSNIARLSEAIEALIVTTSKHYSQEEFKEDRRLLITFQVGNQQTVNRALQFDLSKERFQDPVSKMGTTWTDVGEVALGFADIFLAMQLFLRIPTPIHVRQHMAVFGEKYTMLPPTDPLEKERWSNRFFCLLIGRSDFSSDQGQIDGKDYIWSIEQKGVVLDQRRETSIQCAMCRKIEPEAEGEQLFSKCGRCKMVLYCSRECQTKHWKTHKKACSKPAKQALPEPLLNLDESVNRSHSKLEGNVMYPAVFGVWLFHNYAS